MSRSFTRMIQTEEKSVFVSSARPKEISLPPFDLPGPTYNTLSNPWHPPYDVKINTWYVASSSAGTSDLVIVLVSGDHTFNTTGTYRGKIILPAAKQIVSGPVVFENKTLDYPIISKDQWIKIGLGGSSGHSDITVQMYGEVA